MENNTGIADWYRDKYTERRERRLTESKAQQTAQRRGEWIPGTVTNTNRAMRRRAASKRYQNKLARETAGAR
jgi:hypothetical protein